MRTVAIGGNMNKRKEIYSALDFMVKTKKITLTDKDKRPSFAKLARKYNCDYRTVKRAYEKAISSEKESNDVPKRKSKIDPYIDIINLKIQTGAPAIAIFKYLKNTLLMMVAILQLKIIFIHFTQKEFKKLLLDLKLHQDYKCKSIGKNQ